MDSGAGGFSMDGVFTAGRAVSSTASFITAARSVTGSDASTWAEGALRALGSIALETTGFGLLLSTCVASALTADAGWTGAALAAGRSIVSGAGAIGG